MTILTILICLILTLPIITQAFDLFLKSKLRWRKNIQRLPEKDFYVAVICENLEFDLDLKTHTNELIIAVFKMNVGVASNHNVRIFYSSDRDKKRIRQKGLPL